MTDIIERAEAALAYRRHGDGAHTLFRGRVPLGVVNLGDWASEYLDDLVAELKAERVMRSETQRQLSQFIADFCALRDALPREQVEQILSKAAAND